MSSTFPSARVWATTTRRRIPQPNTRSFAWRDYGNRVGAWRLLELAEAYDLPYGLLINTALYDYCPQMVAAFSKRGDEIIGHGRTNAERQADMPLEAEKQLIQEAAATIDKTRRQARRWAGSRPTSHRRMLRSICCARRASAT